MMMKFMCSAKLNEEGRTRYTWGKDQSAVILFNFSKLLHVKANKRSEQLCVCSPVTATSSAMQLVCPSVGADKACAK